MGMSLKDYHQKRDFKVTSEPKGQKHDTHSAAIFVVQKHAASHLHYDFRLEVQGVLKSWAVPKGPSLDPSVKHLAVQVEDHPLSYARFEGIIPKGQYGAGTVMLWDEGTWEMVAGDPVKAYEQGHLHFILKGKKLHGQWALIRTKSDPKNWLLFKIDDDYAKFSKDSEVTSAQPLSVLSHKTIDEIANNHTANLLLAHKGLMPVNIKPQLATLVTTIPSSNDWLHEVKFDGYRLLCYVNSKIKLLTRGQQDWTRKFPHIVSAIEKMQLPSALLDGEIVVLDQEQHSDFQRLQNALSQHDTSMAIYYVFDLIYYDGNNMTKVPLIERKKQLQQLLETADKAYVRYSDHIIGNGPAVFSKVCRLGLEGIVSKKITSLYTARRTKDWLKAKCIQSQEFVVGGFTVPKGQRHYFGSLLLGVYTPTGEFHYCGHVGTGFTDQSLAEMHALLQRYRTHHMPFSRQPPLQNQPSWVEPRLVIEVEYLGLTHDGILRHPSFKGLRYDKPAREVIMETPKKVNTKKMASSPVAMSPPMLSHPGRILYPQINFSKSGLANYYLSIQDWILPYVRQRPLTLLRCPKGVEDKCFFQKHPNEAKLNALATVAIKEDNELLDYLYLNDVAGLVQLVQLAVLEIHIWNCSIQQIEKPDMLVFDLDPAPDVEWRRVIHAAFFIKERLEEINLQSFVKITGGKGLHLVVPIKSQYSWEEAANFARAFVETLVLVRPNDFVATMSKSHRAGKIFVDYLRNQHGATAIAPYSTRANATATVATPLSWSELTTKMTSTHFTVNNILKRLARLSTDPWENYFKVQQSIDLKK